MGIQPQEDSDTELFTFDAENECWITNNTTSSSSTEEETYTISDDEFDEILEFRIVEFHEMDTTPARQ